MSGAARRKNEPCIFWTIGNEAGSRFEILVKDCCVLHHDAQNTLQVDGCDGGLDSLRACGHIGDLISPKMTREPLGTTRLQWMSWPQVRFQGIYLHNGL